MWNKYTIEKDKVYYWKFGFVEFWVKKIDKKWKIASQTLQELSDETITAKVVGEPESADWHTSIGDKSNTLTLAPALPIRPVVVKPLNPFKLLPNTIVQLYVHIPVTIQLYAGAVKEENKLIELPGKELSSTWFGAPDNGELAFAVKNNFYTDISSELLENNEVLCPVKITNSADGILDFQRLMVHVEFVSIYIHQKKMYTNEIRVKFKGESTVSDISYAHTAPSFLEGAKQLAASRNPEKYSVLKKSFFFIKSLTDY